MPVVRAMIRGSDISGVTRAYKLTSDIYPVISGHSREYNRGTHLANRPSLGRPITCLWCTLAALRAHA